MLRTGGVSIDFQVVPPSTCCVPGCSSGVTWLDFFPRFTYEMLSENSIRVNVSVGDDIGDADGNDNGDASNDDNEDDQ